uniref:DNA topoisomerase n=1 Tax=Scleropages formosus TaxID=113540 RepID=A0A8C9QXU3_SCLFO
MICHMKWLLPRFGIRLTAQSRFCGHGSSEMIRRTEIKRVLCVAEKNDAAKGIAEIMSNGRARKREGYSVYNKIYEYEYHLFGQVRSVSKLSAGDFFLHCRHSCNPVLLFDAEVEKYCPENSVPIKRTLESEARQSQALIIWTDCDREGENIGFEVIDVCKAVKSNIQVFRARFSEITPNSVQRACETLGEPNIHISDAVDVRQELDLRIGAAFTRFQTLRLQKIFPSSLANQLISYGSCQFPTLGFVVERFKAIQAFIPETFFKIQVTHETEDEKVEFSWKRHRLFNHTACLVLYQMCMEDPIATVVSVTSKPKSKWRPLPLDTVELEKLASRKLKINAKETMRIAEKLYTQGYISYPRTETNMFPQGLNLTSLVEQQTQDPEWGAFAQGILDRGGPTPRNGNKSDQAHPPIHPTKYTNSLQGNERRLYEFVVRHFLACCSQDAQGQETTVDIEIVREKFCAHGLMIIARNYLEVYPYEKWYGKVIPVYEQGSQFQPTSMMMVEGETSPPQLLTEADLIALMEKHGIGTDATHAEHIETIKTRLYVGLTPDQRFLPGELGMGLVEGYNSMGYEMSKPDLRAELEADLKLVCEGRKNKAEALGHHVQKYKAVFTESVRKAKKLDEALSVYLGEAQEYTGPEHQDVEMALPVRKCPQCGRDMVLKKKSDGTGKFLSCTGYPSCKTAVWFPDMVLEVSRDESICPTCQPHPVHMLKFKFKKGSLPPMMPLEFVGCIGGCDEMLREVLNLKYLRAGGGGGVSSVTQTNNHSVGALLTSSGAHPASTPAPASRKPAATPTARWTLPPATTESSDVIVCNCGQEAVLLTVRKDGPNKGRQFYKCSTGSCGFFLWVEQSNEQDGANLNFTPPRPSVGFGSAGSGQGATVCGCSEPAVERTVAKEGSNKGRIFLTCRKPREKQCGFFQWLDSPQGTAEAPRATGAGRGSRARRGREAGDETSSMPLVPKRPRACGVCRQPGHTRNNCPLNC